MSRHSRATEALDDAFLGIASIDDCLRVLAYQHRQMGRYLAALHRASTVEVRPSLLALSDLRDEFSQRKAAA